MPDGPDAPLLQKLVLDLLSQMGETNSKVSELTAKLDMYMEEREQSDKRARRYVELHDVACTTCQTRLRAEIKAAAADSPFVAWSNHYKVLVAIALAIILMFGPKLGSFLIRLIEQGG